MAARVIGGRSKRIPSKFIDARILEGTQAHTVQSFVEINVKRGLQFYIETERDYTAGQTLSFLFKTGEKPVILKYFSVAADDSFRSRLFESPTVTSVGTPYQTEVRNYNRIAPVDSTILLYVNPIVSVQGDLVLRNRVHRATNQTSQGGNPIESAKGIEVIMKPNTDYYILQENLVNTNNLVSFWATWYEGETSDDSL